ncbi:discoidin domain-containing protein [Rubritalea tangerina]|uniref:Discoidin domain-containing protein n=1 Tax=Rubritalea tangerina TaxID=430798 RepID=A0ABW4ZEZ5_9BACT
MSARLLLISSALLTAQVSAANLALNATYAYTDGPMPQFDGGTFYFDDGHAGNSSPNAFDSGDLNDDTFFTTGAPTSPAVNTVVAWNPVTDGSGAVIPTEITFDLGTLADITSVSLYSYVYTSFALGAPDDFNLSFSTDGLSFTPQNTINTNFTYTTGQQFITTNLSQTARYVRLNIDGDTIGGDKYSLTEIQIEGTAIPEPSTSGLLLLSASALLIRKRRR